MWKLHSVLAFQCKKLIFEIAQLSPFHVHFPNSFPYSAHYILYFSNELQKVF